MKTRILIILMIAIGSPAFSSDLRFPAALTFEPGFGVGPKAGFPLQTYPSLGTSLTLVGRVASLGPPLQGLDPVGYEITYAFDGSTCETVGNWDDIPCGGGEFGDFHGGTLTIYLDSTPDADFTNIATFRDGDMALIAQTTVIYFLDYDPEVSCPPRAPEPDVAAFFQFVGGIWFDRVSESGNGFEAISLGELDYEVPQNLQAIGFVFRADGIVDIYAPVSVSPTTWGAVKALYR